MKKTEKQNSNSIIKGLRNQSKKTKYILLPIVLVPSVLPILLLFIRNKIMIKLNMTEGLVVNIIIGFLPLVFGITTLLIEYFLTSKKENKQIFNDAVENFNLQIKNYNMIMQKLARNFNTILTEANHISSILIGEISKIIEFKEFINIWEINTKHIVDFSNNVQFRELIRKNIFNVVSKYKEDQNKQEYISVLFLISNIDIVFFEYDALDSSDNICLFNSRNYLSFNKRDNNIITLYITIFGNSILYKTCAYNLKESLTNYKKYIQLIYTQPLNDQILFDLLYDVILKIFRFVEIMTMVSFYLEDTIVILNDRNKKYFKKIEKKLREINKGFKKLDTAINIKYLRDLGQIKNYMDKDTFYKYHNI
ncbi:hypothetical protein [Treponema primitia]|uniref:hypothetical protein n=1 Tax=Treponema primitia TaxID=88058 RepID=UPI00025554D4|nr:hypothetical protein [Treponema primitia]